MNEVLFSELFRESERRKEGAKRWPKKRFLMDRLKEKKGLAIGVYGLRGVGKTTLLLQLANEKEDSLYVNAEELVFRSASLVEFVDAALKKGFRHMFIDEIQAITTWAQQLKMAYDRGAKNVYFSGSSALKIQEASADLSRRALLFYLPPLSFREFLAFGYDVKIEPTSLRELLDFEKRKVLIAKLAPYAEHFEAYLKGGAFPFYFEHTNEIHELCERIIDRVVRRDLAAIEKIDGSYVEGAYKILNTLALSGPNEVSYNSVAHKTGKNIYFVEAALNALKTVGLLNAVRPFKKGVSLIRKEYKFLFAPPLRWTLARALGLNFENVIGGLREDVFASNTFALNPRYVKTDRESKTPDYVLGEKTFELGAHKYKYDVDYYVKDGLTLEKNVIPLPLFCMLY